MYLRKSVPLLTGQFVGHETIIFISLKFVYYLHVSIKEHTLIGILTI